MVILMDFNSILELLKTAERIETLEEHQESIVNYLPDAAIMIGFDQQNRAHQFDLWHHCLHTVLNLPRHMEDDMLYLAALLHDIGKPDCQICGKREDDTNMHYYGHPARSMEIVRDRVIPELIAKGVSLTSDEKRRLLYYVEYHDDRVSMRQKHLRRHLQIASLGEFKNLMRLQVADAKAHIMLPVIEERIRICSAWADGYADELYPQIASSLDTVTE